MPSAKAADPKSEVLVETRGAVGLVRLNRPEVLNALSYSVMEKVVEALEAFDRDDAIRCIVLAGSAKAFAAGADIKELEGAKIHDMVYNQQMPRWDRIRRVQKPIVAAVSGFALGGGCELAMACDLIVASETAVFGQPEINIGVMPGAGGTQRLTRAVGKAVAMDMVLTGRRMAAQEALQRGLVARVVPVEAFLDEAMAVAQAIAAKPPIAVLMAKDGVSRALDTSLETALSYERKLFYLLFGTEDQKEGMAAFREKRKPSFKGK
ncbi:MAG TPA: enoyl-CoA hydratase-related protein [Elusimicrobiota bacterium]|jgi:enoyl-CoA hydratase|nr:enoyl-CoA hydratase-related protein [Elusimicrobiota bacterium]